MSDDMPNLSTCPFCGGGETRIDETKTRASVLEPYEIMGVYVRHWCGGFARAAARNRGRAMTDDKIAEIRARHESPGVLLPLEALGRSIEDRATLLAEVERLRANNDNLTLERDEARAENVRLREVIRTIRARCVELDDSDAVSETLDITSAALEGKP